MTTHTIHLPRGTKPAKRDRSVLGGCNPKGERIGLTSYYLERDGLPFFAISGEFHYSRCAERYWRDELIKMKMGGINIVATYIFWNHHEELQGSFDWHGNKSLRCFVELCASLDLWVIIRIGPWCHGECRNGGFPDWLYGRPFALRANDPQYLAYVATWYGQVAAQVKGLLYKDGGPIVGTQLENEHMHSAAPWEMTTGNSHEWTTAGSDGDAHILTLKRMAIEAGIDTPLYTCTAWGGGSAPVPEVLPVWGGYAFQPWRFYEEITEHPATPEYIFRDYHNDAVPSTYNFEPRYRPEDYPYACCEIGGGMQVYYRYRFILPPESVEAMAVVKVAGGCNFLGYYMFHGGTNPRGKAVPFLNENVTPKLSYDYQAPIGECGQLREHYFRLKAQHQLLQEFGRDLCSTQTVLPAGADAVEPRDVDTLRYAVRANGSSGFLFLNNYQDHIETIDHRDVSFALDCVGTVLRIPAEGGLVLARGVSCVLPVNFDLDGVTLSYALAQPLTKCMGADGPVYFFASVSGMRGEYSLLGDETMVVSVNEHATLHPRAHGTPSTYKVTVDETATAVVRLATSDGKVRTIVALSRSDGLHLWKAKLRETEHVVICGAALLADESASGGRVRVEYAQEESLDVKVFPPLPADIAIAGASVARGAAEEPFACYRLTMPAASPMLSWKRVDQRHAVFSFDRATFAGFKRVILQVSYVGDVGNAYIDGELIADNFNNGAVWEIGLTEHEQALLTNGMYIDIVPIKQGSKVVHATNMAGRYEVCTEATSMITEARIVGVREISLC